MTNPPVLVCATEAGGVANVAPLLPLLVRCGTAPVVVTSTAMAPRFSGHGHQIVTRVRPEGAAAIVDRVKPQAVICGTTRFDSPDRQLIGEARARGIRVTVVIDECYGFRDRFADAQGDVACWPDAITLLDEQSRVDAGRDGLPPDRLHVTGSPALALTRRVAAEFMAAPPPRPTYMAAAGKRPVVTFLSETIAADYGVAPERPGAMGPYIGFTEASVLAHVREALAGLPAPAFFVHKLHPAAPSAFEGSSDDVTIRDVALWPLLWHSNAVIGMRTAALLETFLLGVPAASVQPGLISAERCTAVRLGVVPRVDSLDDLRRWLRKQMTRSHTVTPRAPQLPCASPDAADRIVRIALAGLAALGAHAAGEQYGRSVDCQ